MAITFMKIVIIITKNNKNPPINLLIKVSKGFISSFLIILRKSKSFRISGKLSSSQKK